MTKSVNYLKVCQECGAACCKIGGPDLTEEEAKRILKKGHKKRFVKVEPNCYEIKSKKLKCTYLKKDNSCEIQDAKPSLCLCWPILPGYKKKKRLNFIVECPLTSNLTKREIKQCKKEASKVSKKVIDYIFKKSKLPKEEIDKMKKKWAKFKKRELK